MMPSTMILTICSSMVLKHNRGLSLDIGSRYGCSEKKVHGKTSTGKKRPLENKVHLQGVGKKVHKSKKIGPQHAVCV